MPAVAMGCPVRDGAEDPREAGPGVRQLSFLGPCIHEKPLKGRKVRHIACDTQGLIRRNLSNYLATCRIHNGGDVIASPIVYEDVEITAGILKKTLNLLRSVRNGLPRRLGHFGKRYLGG